MQAMARMAPVVSSTRPARNRLTRNVRHQNHALQMHRNIIPIGRVDHSDGLRDYGDSPSRGNQIKWLWNRGGQDYGEWPRQFAWWSLQQEWKAYSSRYTIEDNNRGEAGKITQ